MVEKHTHNGADSDRLEGRFIKGFFETVTSFPTSTPKNWLEQIKIFDDTAGSGEFFIVMYDTVGGAWHQVDNTP